MKRTIRRLALIASCSSVLLALIAAPALATTATTGRVTDVTTSSAVLHGVIGTGGVATYWEFQYGKTSRYGKTAPVPPRLVSRGAPAVSVRVTGLSPGTTYHYRLVALVKATRATRPYYYFVATHGADRKFTTHHIPRGKVTLVAKLLPVKKGRVTIKLKCGGVKVCKGRVKITKRITVLVKHRRKMTTIVCAAADFTIRAGKTAMLRPTVGPACLTLLKSAKHHKIGAKLEVRPTSGQASFGTGVTLALK
jgi:hypothetical protein